MELGDGHFPWNFILQDPLDWRLTDDFKYDTSNSFSEDGLLVCRVPVDSKSQNLLISQCSNSLTEVCSVLKLSFVGRIPECEPESKYPGLDFIALGQFP